MKRCLSVLLVLSVLLCALPAGADTRYCPYCGTKVDSAYSFCPSCGKSLSGTGSAGNAAAPSSGYGSDLIPGLNLSFSELKEIVYRIYRDPKGTYDRGLSNFPIRVSIDLQSEGGLQRMNYPHPKQENSNGSFSNVWRYDITRGRFLTEDEKFGGPVSIRYIHSTTPSNKSWGNQIYIYMGTGEEISYLLVTAGGYSPNTRTNRLTYQMGSQSARKTVAFWIENGQFHYDVSHF